MHEAVHIAHPALFSWETWVRDPIWHGTEQNFGWSGPLPPACRTFIHCPIAMPLFAPYPGPHQRQHTAFAPISSRCCWGLFKKTSYWYHQGTKGPLWFFTDTSSRALDCPSCGAVTTVLTGNILVRECAVQASRTPPRCMDGHSPSSTAKRAWRLGLVACILATGCLLACHLFYSGSHKGTRAAACRPSQSVTRCYTSSSSYSSSSTRPNVFSGASRQPSPLILRLCLRASNT